LSFPSLLMNSELAGSGMPAAVSEAARTELLDGEDAVEVFPAEDGELLCLHYLCVGG
jgi:hypothetical protein